MEIMNIANSLPLWIASAIPVALVMIQAGLFATGAYRAGEKVGLEKSQLNRAIKSSAITSIGPSIVVLSGMLSLLVTVGAPFGWMRLSMIGSVMFESIAAGLGTSAVGVTLGTDPMTGEALAMAVWTMILCSIGWVLFATFAANKMDHVEKKVSKGNTKTLTTIATGAIIGVFAAMCAQHLSKPLYLWGQNAAADALAGPYKNVLAVILGGVFMFLCTTLAEKKNMQWLKEWGLTITILAAMIITALI